MSIFCQERLEIEKKLSKDIFNGNIACKSSNPILGECVCLSFHKLTVKCLGLTLTIFFVRYYQQILSMVPIRMGQTELLLPPSKHIARW